VTRDGMPRAYLRIDPNLDQHPDPLAMVLLLCAGARQAERGRFKDRAVIVRAIGPAKTKALSVRQDIVQLPDGRWYIEGWDEWQEGDHTVAERMQRMRARRALRRRTDVAPATRPALHDRNDVTTDAGIERTLGSSLSGVGDGDEDFPAPTAVGRRSDGTNPRALGTNPRSLGQSPRQERAAAKRGGIPVAVSELLRRAQSGEPA
jgi:hypothetical protein